MLRRRKGTDVSETRTLVLGAIALLLSFLPVLGIPVGVCGLVFAVVGTVLAFFGGGVSLRWSLIGVAVCALALATNPTLLLLDEPTAGMTPGETKEATALIRRIALDRHLTVLLIEHDMSVVMGISDRIAVLHFGEKIAEGSPEAIRSDPKVLDAYLGGADE